MTGQGHMLERTESPLGPTQERVKPALPHASHIGHAVAGPEKVGGTGPAARLLILWDVPTWTSLQVPSDFTTSQSKEFGVGGRSQGLDLDYHLAKASRLLSSLLKKKRCFKYGLYHGEEPVSKVGGTP